MAGVATAGAAALMLTGCGATNTASNYQGCIVSDSGGFDDQSFNQSSYEGLKKVTSELGLKMNQAESKTNNDFEPNLRAMVSAGCNLTITVGFLLGDATKSQATANPDKHFAIIDFGYDKPISTVKPVATFGGIKIPTVTIFMDGYADGVKYYNEQKGKNVKVLGWDKAKQDGSFTGDFEKQDKGKQFTQNFLDQGADIVMPVAGPVGKGAAAALQEAKAAGKDVKLIWVDSDGFLTAPDYKDIMLSSVMKQMGQAVEAVVKQDKDGQFTNKPYVGTLANDGVQLAPFHDMDSQVPAELKSELDQIKKDIADGKLKVESAASPKV